jgi:hypothetical protein
MCVNLYMKDALEHHLPHGVLDAGVLLGVHLAEVHLSISTIRQLARPLTTSTATSERHQRAQAPLTGYA